MRDVTMATMRLRIGEISPRDHLYRQKFDTAITQVTEKRTKLFP